MTPLYQDISLADRSAILQVLNGLGISYKMDEGEILVDSEKARELRMILAAEGLPSSGSIVGYEIFNKSEALGTSTFSQNVNLLRALEGELSRTIASFDNIQMARVHLVLPKKELFSRESHKPKASVILKVRENPNNKQMSAITHLVASAVQGLDVNNVTIVSTDGKPFKLPNDSQGNMISSSLQEYKLAVEQKLKHSVEDLIGKFIGVDKVRAEVNIELDLERLTIDAEVFDPEGQVVRSLQNNEEDSESADNIGAVSVSNNIPNANSYDNGPRSNSIVKKREEVINYEVSREITKKIKEVGEIKKLSVAVLIDGNYVHNNVTGEYDYVPHSNEVIGKLYALVGSAVGFDKNRGDTLEIINMQFHRTPDHRFINNEINNVGENQYVIINIVGCLLIILLMVVLVKWLLGKRLDKSVDTTIERPPEVQSKESDIAVIKKLELLISDNVESAVSLLKEWMKDGK